METADEPNIGNHPGASGQFQGAWVCGHSPVQRCSKHPWILAWPEFRVHGSMCHGWFLRSSCTPWDIPWLHIPSSLLGADLPHLGTVQAEPSFRSLTALFWPAFLKKGSPCHGVVRAAPFSGCFSRGETVGSLFHQILMPAALRDRGRK